MTCAVLVLLLSSITVSASSQKDPRVYEVCNGKPYHEMYPKVMIGDLVISETGERYISSGYFLQCQNCYLGMVTDGNPSYVYPDTQRIGRDGTCPLNEWMSKTAITLYTDAAHCGYTDATSLNGYKFY